MQTKLRCTRASKKRMPLQQGQDPTSRIDLLAKTEFRDPSESLGLLVHQRSKRPFPAPAFESTPKRNATRRAECFSHSDQQTQHCSIFNRQTKTHYAHNYRMLHKLSGKHLLSCKRDPTAFHKKRLDKFHLCTKEFRT